MTFDDLKGFSPDAQRQIITQMVKDGKKVEKPSKYHAEKDSRGDIKFDSKKEARKFDELLPLYQSGEIRKLKLQPEFTLQEAYTTVDGKRIPAIRYRADFSYERKTPPDTYGYVYWVPVVIDTKGVKTDVYRMKAKMFIEKFGFPITEC